MTHCDLPGTALRVAPDHLPDPQIDIPATTAPQQAVLAGGCFWCVEAVYRRLDGVLDVRSGYAGGSADSANYEAVCSGRTGHAEAVLIRFDPARISYGQLLKVFFGVAHDPTQRDRQGNDIGPQYRSAVFYADDAQRRVAERYIAQLDAAGVYSAPIATTLEPLQAFHEAEAYHQDYAARNPHQPYIVHVAAPKVEKLQRHFRDRLRNDRSDDT
ncbi:peptide-methionine (S)-S-oxide reductase MsrA [Rehaibacterium terrae]|jgi:peptide-methionine (S)-S-oxide reductase|uniref:Peptide methionine sulfoxide reductase MsrA n=1 Tax=Rehaibacterium terrae TaxID=1341696 RepID=A0A7W7Y244_9GAMM|nr:peptide-methionine (S)-S-oxide reductase MsrA [Rehaibacterium terrae]MBB5016709.1 peptide-methionine (S)-S-oxide reductase [Rehaibacterium terrae]